MKTKSIPLIFLTLCVILLCSACYPSWARKVPAGQIIYISGMKDPYALTFIDEENDKMHELEIRKKFDVPVWSLDGISLFGLSGFSPSLYGGWPAFWNIQTGRVKTCKTQFPVGTRVQDAGNHDNPMEVVFSQVRSIDFFDISTCKYGKNLVNYDIAGRGSYVIAGFSYSRSEETLVFSMSTDQFSENFRIISLDLISKKEVALTDGINPDLSPDGQYIAYLGMDGALYLMKVDGSEQKLMVKKLFWDSNHKDNTVQPEWSPDSKWLVYHRCVGESPPISNCNIYKVNIETGIEVKLAEGGVFPSWGNR